MAITGNLGDIRKSAYLEMRDVIIPNEIKERKEADKALDEKIEEEKKAREKDDDDLRKLIKDEEKAREGADEGLDDKIEKETTDRKAADTVLGDRIDAEAEARQSADTTLDDKIDEETERSKAVEKNIMEAFNIEQSARVSGDTALGERIDAEAEARQSADKELDGKINNKANKGTVSSIDGLYLPGIYYNAKDITITYTKIDGTEVNTLVNTLIVSANEATDSGGNIHIGQTAIVDADSSYFCVLTREGTYNHNTEIFSWRDWKRTDEDIFNEFRGTLKYPQEVTKERLDKTWQSGWYMCNFRTPEEVEGSPEHLVQVVNDRGYDDCYTVTQILYADGLPQYYRSAHADTFDGYAGVLDETEFNEWLIAGPSGTWAKPFIVSDPNVNLSTLTTPGIYYFDFDELKDIGDCGCYNRGYMEVSEVWGDNAGRIIISQKICVGFEGQTYNLERTINPGIAKPVDNDTGWKRFETSRIWEARESLEERVKSLEEKIKALENKADRGKVTDQTMDTTFAPGIYQVDNGGTPLTDTDACPYILIVSNSDGTGQNGNCYQIYFCTGNDGNANIICYRYWDGQKWSDFEEFYKS